LSYIFAGANAHGFCIAKAVFKTASMYYKIVFAKNRIVSCNETLEKAVTDEPYYEHRNGQLTYAIILADNESQARSIAKYLALELMQRYDQHNAA
jgi:hypothetical protein